MKITNRARILALGLSAALAVGVVGSVMAQEGGGSDSPAAETHHARRHHPILAGIHQVVEASGLDASLFREGFKDGKSINQILSENGKDPATVQADALANTRTKLDEKVAAGELTQQQADTIYDRAVEALPKLMDATPPDRMPHPRLARGFVRSAAESIGIEPRELAGELRDGATVADVATEHGVDPAQVISDMTADANARIDEALANGRIDEEQAAKLKERAAAAIERLVNEGRPDKPATD